MEWSFPQYGRNQLNLRESSSLTGTTWTNLPRWLLGYGFGSLRFGTITSLFTTGENLRMTHSSSYSISNLPMIDKVIMFEEYHFWWKLRSESLMPGFERLLTLPQLNLHMLESLFDIIYIKFSMCQASFYNDMLNSESTALTSRSVQSSLKLGLIKNWDMRSRAPSKPSFEHSNW